MARTFTIDSLVRFFTRPWLYLLPIEALLLGNATATTVLITNLALATFFIFWWLLKSLNDRLAFGKPRPLNNELVVITGGSSGLGKRIAKIFIARTDAPVAILDVQRPKDQHFLMKWYSCDVGDAQAVARAAEQIRKDLGSPTILINNAAIVNGKPLLDLQPSEVEQSIKVNLMAHFNTIHTFLPAMLARPEGGSIVTIASVLGHLGAAQLSDYAAAKAGLLAMHTSLSAELAHMSIDVAPGARNIKTLLVKPGQLSTALFRGMPTPSQFFGPVVEAQELANVIVETLGMGRGGVIAAPLYTRWIEAFFVLPYGVQAFLRRLSGMDRAMDKFGSKPVKDTS